MQESIRTSGAKLLEGKTAVVYGAGGAVGSAVATAFAREGATIFLSGRTRASLQATASKISNEGGKAEVSVVDALDVAAVEAHLREVTRTAGRLDISFNITSNGVEMGHALSDLSEERFSQAAFTFVRSNFVTATNAARIMQKQGHGVILGITASVARLPRANLGGFAIAGASIEALLRQLALEVGPRGVRVVCLRTTATPDNPTLDEVFTILAKESGTTKDVIEREEAKRNAMQHLPRLPDLARAAVLLASDYAGAITATAVDASCGDVVD